MTSLIENTSIQIPDEFYCPITGNLMEDPVIVPGGHSYERASILKWLQVKEICPLTRKPLSVDDLTPNRALKYLIDEIRGKITEEHMINTARKINLGELDGLKFTPHVSSYVSGNKVHVKLSSKCSGKNNSLNIGFVIDTSGSMDQEAIIQDENKISNKDARMRELENWLNNLN